MPQKRLDEIEVGDFVYCEWLGAGICREVVDISLVDDGKIQLWMPSPQYDGSSVRTMNVKITDWPYIIEHVANDTQKAFYRLKYAFDLQKQAETSD